MVSTRLIRLQDGTLVEIEARPGEVQQLSGGLAEKVSATLEEIRPLLVRLATPIAAAWKEINETAYVEQAEVELSLSFEAGGDLYVVKSQASASIAVKLILKPKNNAK